MTTGREVFFDDAEYAHRLAGLRAAMAREGIDTFVTTSPGNVCYLIGHFTQAVNDLMFLAVPAEGAPLLQVPMYEQARFDASGVGAECVSTWILGEDPAERVISELARRGLDRGTVAVDVGGTYTPYAVIQKLFDGLDARAVDAMVERLRLVKSPSELAYLREAAPMTDAGVRAALDTIREGATDYEIAAATLSALVGAGSEAIVSDPYVCVGWRVGAPHSNRGGAVCRRGDPVFIELGGTRARYTAPIIRTAAVGEAGPLQELADTSSAILDAIIPAMKPGVPAQEVAAIGRQTIDPLLDRIIFHHVYGYSVGLSFAPGWLDCPHFMITERNPAPLEAGMVFHQTMNLRVKGRYGAGHSEAVIVTEAGGEILSKLPRELAIR
jgi:Xaa-Pro aminopeptidase